MGSHRAAPDHPLFLYVLVIGNLIAVAGMAFILLGLFGALGLITAVTDSLGGLGSSFASATTGSAVMYSFTFLAGVLSLAASWKMFRERPRQWLLTVVAVFQIAAAAVFHSWVSVIALIPTVAALYGLAVAFLSPIGARQTEVATSAAAIPQEYPPSEPATAPTTAVHETARPARPAIRPTLEPNAEVPSESSDNSMPSAAPLQRARRCADCGAVNVENARFCHSCGSILPGTTRDLT